MRRLSILLLLGFITSAHGQDRAEGRKIVLFGARWCAPCMGEYRQLDALVAAARPERIVLAWTDNRMAAPVGMRPDAIDSLDAREAQLLAVKLAGEGYGLPFSAMLDAKGRACALWNAPLHPADVATLRARCDAR